MLRTNRVEVEQIDYPVDRVAKLIDLGVFERTVDDERCDPKGAGALRCAGRLAVTLAQALRQ